jgi:ferredoxin-NADP reductase
MNEALLDHVKHEGHNIYTFWFKVVKKVDQIPGQFIEVHLPHANPDTRGIRRWFTISSAPDNRGLISITTKMADENGSSFKTALRAMEKGHKVKISDPMGDFVLPRDNTIPLVFVSGGIGITPFHSIITYLKEKQEKRNIQLFYGARELDELVFDNELKQLEGLDFIPVIQNAPFNYYGQTGFLDSKKIFEQIKEKENARVYISGPEPMVEKFKKEFEDLGINKNNLVCDYFPGYN